MSEERIELEALAREIYRDHKKVLDFVMQYGAGSDFAVAVKGFFEDSPNPFKKIKIGTVDLVFLGLNNSSFSFLPLTWYEKFGERRYQWRGCEKWWVGYPLICWVGFWTDEDAQKGRIRLYAEVGPISDPEVRGNFIEAIKELAAKKGKSRITFQKNAHNKDKKYSKFFKVNTKNVGDVHDVEVIKEAVEALIEDFKGEFDVVSEVLDSFSWSGVKVDNAE